MTGQKVPLLTDDESVRQTEGPLAYSGNILLFLHISSNSGYRHRVMLTLIRKSTTRTHTFVQDSFPVKKCGFCLLRPCFSSKHIQYKGVYVMSPASSPDNNRDHISCIPLSVLSFLVGLQMI
jgi:hypothetical protein